MIMSNRRQLDDACEFIIIVIIFTEGQVLHFCTADCRLVGSEFSRFIREAPRCVSLPCMLRWVTSWLRFQIISEVNVFLFITSFHKASAFHAIFSAAVGRE